MFDKHFLYNLFQIGFYHGYYKTSTKQFYSSTPMFENIKLKSNNTVDYLIGDLEKFSKKLEITTQSNLIDKYIAPLDVFDKIEYITQSYLIDLINNESCDMLFVDIDVVRTQGVEYDKIALYTEQWVIMAKKAN